MIIGGLEGSLSIEQLWRPGRYYILPLLAADSAASNLGNGVLHVFRAFVPNAVLVSRIGAGVTAAGQPGSQVRLGIYADDGDGHPGSLIVDAGVLNGASATVQELTTTTPLSNGWHWFALAVQNAPTTQPALRINALSTQSEWGPLMPTGNFLGGGFIMTGVPGALPPTFSITSTGLRSPRMFIRV